MSTTEDDHRIQFHVDSSHSTTHPCTPILSAKMSDDIAVSDIALNISQPHVQWYVKFPVTIINQKRQSFNSKSTPGLNTRLKRCCILLCLPLFVMLATFFHPLIVTESRKLLPKLVFVIGGKPRNARKSITRITSRQWHHGVNM